MPLAQSVPSLAMLLAVFVPLVLLAVAMAAIVLILRHLRYTREKQHKERMKMIEMGYPLEDSESSKRQDKFMHNAFWISFWMVFAVPGAAFGAAATATERIEAGTGVLLAIWIGAAIASVASVVCAAVLMICSRSGKDELDGEPRIPKKPPQNV